MCVCVSIFMHTPANAASAQRLYLQSTITAPMCKFDVSMRICRTHTNANIYTTLAHEHNAAAWQLGNFKLCQESGIYICARLHLLSFISNRNSET